MADTFTREKRSDIMAKIKGHGNAATELRLIKIFRSCSVVGWRRNRPVFGRPDFVFPAIRLAIFVDGCFWHGCPLHGQTPKTNSDFWARKLTRNKSRDRLVNRTLKERGWTVMRIWQHELRESERVASRLQRVLARAAVRAGD